MWRCGGLDLRRSMPVPPDGEMHLTIQMSWMLQRREFCFCFLVSRGLTCGWLGQMRWLRGGAWFRILFNPQFEGMRVTDVLDLYRAFAEENICVGHSTGAGKSRLCFPFFFLQSLQLMLTVLFRKVYHYPFRTMNLCCSQHCVAYACFHVFTDVFSF